jgi:hypothetical protein
MRVAAAVRYAAYMIDTHRRNFVRAHKEGLPAMKADSLFRIALHTVHLDRALINPEPVIKKPDDFVSLFANGLLGPVIKRPYAVVRYEGV